jgi:hypothetical protein
LNYAFSLRMWIWAVNSCLYRCGIPLPPAGGNRLLAGKKTCTGRRSWRFLRTLGPTNIEGLFCKMRTFVRK